MFCLKFEDTDRQTDGCNQIYYLPATRRSIINIISGSKSSVIQPVLDAVLLLYLLQIIALIICFKFGKLYFKYKTLFVIRVYLKFLQTYNVVYLLLAYY